jgi:hypothetical protein
MGLFYKFWRLGINTLVNMQLESIAEIFFSNTQEGYVSLY